jgi:hypothetical protein
MRPLRVAVALLAACSVTVVGVRVADACGCVSPPLPDPLGKKDYAVNQLAEQIIFEVDQNWITAHVLIKYAGDPEQFAWIVPVAEAPELSLSPVSAFALLDRATEPDVAVELENLCPVSEWACQYHPAPDCGGGGGCGQVSSDNAAGGDDDFGFADAGASDAGGGAPEEDPVTVIGTEVVGDYQTVTFRASEAAAAAQWLRDNGFIVNPTTTIYMEPYVEANMVFVAAKLVPGAGVNAIKPLRMRFRAPFPMIPLVLTAVAAEPHLTVTTFIYANQPFRPMSHPMVTIDPGRIAQDREGRNNYPMVLSRTVDEAGGDGFAVEYRGVPAVPEFGAGTGCCGGDWDFCGIGNNTRCECPRDDFDAGDCSETSDVVEGVALLDDLATRYTRLTRLTTRISPEEMRFDPTFEADAGAPLFGRMVARGEQASLDRCSTRVVDANQDEYAEIDAKQDCAAVYCGAGQCVTTDAGPACVCDAGFVARRFLDLDAFPSVTCIPRTPTVDLGAGGLELPDACAGISCGMGQCIDRNGVPVCECNGGSAAVAGDTGPIPTCAPINELTRTPGAQDFSQALRDLTVCAAPLPSCEAGGWYARVASPRVGPDCGDATPTAAQQEPTPEPHCEGLRGMYGCGCSGTHPVGALGLAWIVAFLLLRKRPTRGRAS